MGQRRVPLQLPAGTIRVRAALPARRRSTRLEYKQQPSGDRDGALPVNFIRCVALFKRFRSPQSNRLSTGEQHAASALY